MGMIDTRLNSPAEQLEAAVTRLRQVVAVDYLREARAHRRFAHVAGGDANGQVAIAAQFVCTTGERERYQSNFAPDFDANESRRLRGAEGGIFRCRVQTAMGKEKRPLSVISAGFGLHKLWPRSTC